MRSFIISTVIFFLSFGATNVNEYYLIPGGENIAFEMYSKGLIVTGNYDVYDGKILYNPSVDSDINKGDIITGLNSNNITDLNSFLNSMKRVNGSECIIKIQRKNKYLNKKLKLINIKGVIKTGLYVKERILGIGTVSFYDPNTMTYGALGHEVYDNDTESILEVREGNIYLEDIKDINKSTNGHVGSKDVDLEMNENIGNVEYNTQVGIFGSVNDIPSAYQAIETATFDEIKLSEATIRTCINENNVEEFKINILKKNNDKKEKNIYFEVIDKILLNETGGIIQGMSGSPIIQNNKLVGAVSHAIVNNPKTGYGIFIDYMIEKSMIKS